MVEARKGACFVKFRLDNAAFVSSVAVYQRVGVGEINSEFFTNNCQSGTEKQSHVSAIIPFVNRGKKKPQDRPVFDSIRKPTAPAGKKFGGDKPEERVHPSLRKVKHKKKPSAGDVDV